MRFPVVVHTKEDYEALETFTRSVVKTKPRLFEKCTSWITGVGYDKGRITGGNRTVATQAAAVGSN